MTCQALRNTWNKAHKIWWCSKYAVSRYVADRIRQGAIYDTWNTALCDLQGTNYGRRWYTEDAIFQYRRYLESKIWLWSVYSTPFDNIQCPKYQIARYSRNKISNSTIFERQNMTLIDIRYPIWRYLVSKISNKTIFEGENIKQSDIREAKYDFVQYMVSHSAFHKREPD